MTELRIERVAGDAMLQDWRHVHNAIIPTDAFSLDKVRERAGRHLLEVAYLDDVLVGCSTVRPPEAGVATVIARVLPGHRRRGFGERIYERGLELARGLGADTIETVVLESNPEGLRFAEQHGFTEIERYLLPGDTIRFIDLRLTRT